ncbi:MAG: hypothetical protein U5J63_13400 [Fodinibius sp.]|nr:hypothetical protein [Fodinibius sp.]
MVKVTIADQTKALQEVTSEWITSTISKNRIMNKENSVEINIDSDNVNLNLFANCAQAGQEDPSNDIEGRIVFLWHELVLGESDLDPSAIYDFLKRMDEWVSFVPKSETK